MNPIGAIKALFILIGDIFGLIRDVFTARNRPDVVQGKEAQQVEQQKERTANEVQNGDIQSVRNDFAE